MSVSVYLLIYCTYMYLERQILEKVGSVCSTLSLMGYMQRPIFFNSSDRMTGKRQIDVQSPTPRVQELHGRSIEDQDKKREIECKIGKGINEYLKGISHR